MAHPLIPDCDLCDTDGGALIFRTAKWRVVRVTGAEGDAFRGFCRVIWNDHVKELTDLAPDDRQQFMEVVFKVEKVLRTSLSPHKMNLASLGNLTPHLHWHVIPRFTDDPAFPRPIWAVDVTVTTGLDTLSDKHRRGTENGEWEVAVRRALDSE
ncbi:MAG: HIT family protein [Betaproteobacteria bacterium]